MAHAQVASCNAACQDIAEAGQVYKGSGNPERWMKKK
jgi:hypothetical protein